jgi:Holliday junction resolvasome RuvABC ATP-dependent DNA helicase subunit
LIEGLDRLPRQVVASLGRLNGGPSVSRQSSSPNRSISVVATVGVRPRLDDKWTIAHIEPYERDSVAEILRQHFGWHIEVRRLIALAGRLRPARALERGRELLRISNTSQITERHAVAALQRWGLDRLGLDQRDQQVIATLTRRSSATVKQLLTSVAVSEQEMRYEILQYLFELGLVCEIRPGRWSLTSAGAEAYG